MSKIITTADKNVYDSLFDLESYSEKALQHWLAKYKSILFDDHYCFLSGYNFTNRKGHTSAGDLILISKDFSEWWIIEVELAKKELAHTKYQLGVFTDVNLDVLKFKGHCERKESVFHGKYQKELESCLKTTPNVLVIFDFEDSEKVEELKQEFPQIKISFCELYLNKRHSSTVLRIHGESTFVRKDSTYLTPDEYNKSVYWVSEPDMFKKFRLNEYDFISQGRLNKFSIIRTPKKFKIKIDDHGFRDDATLILELSTSGKFLLRAVN